MANTQAMCRQFMIDLMAAKHAFMTTVTRGATTKDTFKGALYLTTATVDATTTAYNATGEVGNSGSYSAGGIAFTNATDPAGSGTAANGTGNIKTTVNSIVDSNNFTVAITTAGSYTSGGLVYVYSTKSGAYLSAKKNVTISNIEFTGVNMGVTITGAAQNALVVVTPATREPSAQRITTTSLRPGRLMPAEAMPSSKPGTGCRVGRGPRPTAM